MTILPWHVVVDDEGLGALADIEELVGSLILRDPLRACVLPNLRSISGHLSVEGGLADLRLDALTRVGGQLTVFGAGLTALELPALVEVGAALELDGNLALERVSCPSLRTIGASLIVDDNPTLAALALPSLESIAIAASRSNTPGLDEEAWMQLARLAPQSTPDGEQTSWRQRLE